MLIILTLPLLRRRPFEASFGLVHDATPMVVDAAPRANNVEPSQTVADRQAFAIQKMFRSWDLTYALDWFQVEFFFWIVQNSGSEIIKNIVQMKYFHQKSTLKIVKWGCSRHVKISRFLTILIFSTFYKNRVNWPSSGSKNWMHDIIIKIFGKKYFRKVVKWWCWKANAIKNLNF